MGTGFVDCFGCGNALQLARMHAPVLQFCISEWWHWTNSWFFYAPWMDYRCRVGFTPQEYTVGACGDCWMVQLLGILRCTHLNIPTLNTVPCIKGTMDTCWPMEYLLHCSFQFTLAYKDRMTLKQRFLLLIYCRTHQIPFSCVLAYFLVKHPACLVLTRHIQKETAAISSL